MRGRTIVFIYRAGSVLSAAAPHWLIVAASWVIARGLYVLMKGPRATVEANMRHALGRSASSAEVERSTRAAFYFYVYYWTELLRLPAVPHQELSDKMSLEGREILDLGLAKGNGVILALPHLGSWDYAGAWMATMGFPMTVVAEPLEPPELYDWFLEQRSRLGMMVVPLGPDAVGVVLEALRNNRVVGLLCDRDLVGSGIEVEFFGERTTLPAGPATLALRSGAAIVPTAVYTLPHGDHLAVLLPAVSLERAGRFRDDVRRITQDLARQLEVLIRRVPEQWHMFQPNWPAEQLAK